MVPGGGGLSSEAAGADGVLQLCHACAHSTSINHTSQASPLGLLRSPIHANPNRSQGYRYAMPHSILMMHHPSGASRGQASEMHIESRELVRMRDYLSLLVSDHTGQPYDRVR